MHCTHSSWHLGMPHTIRGALGEVALLAHAQDLHWKELGALAGCPASRFRDAAGSEVYASIYFAEFDGGGEHGLAAFRPDDRIEVFGALGRYGLSMLDGVHRLYPAGTAPSEAASVPPSLVLRLSFVLAHADRGQPPRPLPPRQRGDRDAGRGGEDQMIPAAEQRVERLARMTREPDAERRRHHAARGRERSSRRSARQVEEHEGTRDGEQTARLDEDAERGAQRLGDGRRGGRAPQGVEERARHSLEEVGLHDPVRVGLESAPRVGAVRLAPVHAARRPTSHALEVFAVPPPCQA
jgi:probable biosynthetic protein (TIGR04098 family)